MYKLMNTAMMPRGGYYALFDIDQEEFVHHVQCADAVNQLESYIGYPQTAEFVEQLTGIKIEVNRTETKIASGDILLIIKLRYRVNAPKGEPVKEEDFIFQIANYREFPLA